MSSITKERIESYISHLREEERSESTVRKYHRQLMLLYSRLPKGASLDKEILLRWKQEISEQYSAGTVNVMLAAINGFLDFYGWSAYKMKPLKVQRRIFREEEREMTKEEYIRLITTAKREQNHRLQLIMETLGSTGIRISELKFITAEAVQAGQAVVNCKGKQRVVILTKKLCRLLKDYCRKRKITTGAVFVTKQGNPIDRSNVWKEMKRLCQAAGVDSRKVFPHNFRHLFAVLYYRVYKDIAKLADLLGHASIVTTRIYLMESGLMHERQVTRLGLVI